MPNTPTQPDDPPTEGASPDANTPGQGKHGMAHGQEKHDASGSPSDDRHDSETAALKQD